MFILAGVVLYNPNINRLIDNIDAIYGQVDTILLVNNGSDNVAEIQRSILLYNNIVFINNKKNRGIATALKQIMDYAVREHFDWVLTLDQDTVCVQGLLAEYRKYVSMDNAGILTCNIVDRNFLVNTDFKEGQMWKETRWCITSASLINTDAYKQTDGFDEKLFIDSVDFDICINMRKHDFKIIKVNFDGVLHEVGHGKNVKLLFKDYIVYNHPPFREYYMARNHMYIVKKYPDEFSVRKEIIREIRTEILILLFEKHKAKKLYNRWKGLRDVKTMNV